ncbi:MAG TPA: glutamate formimidoyltransferase [Bryobacteraceae bacterium]|jgi:glutamate formiminotransferase
MIECIPNFSEGRDAGVVRAIVDAIARAPGILVLGWESDSDHNRSVVTFAGAGEAVMEAAVRGVGKAAELIDLSAHEGVHPRTGAADVVPFAPLEGSTLAECVTAARWAGEQIWERFGVPVYFYEAAALTPGRQRLEKIRRKEFDGLPSDVGATAAHPTAGASIVGAREFLIAYNVLLDTPDVTLAAAIARKIRESSGGFRHVKSIGLYLESRARAQVSMNLTNFADTPLNQVYECIETEAARLGTRVADGELIGFIPSRAFQMWPDFFQRASNFDSSRIIERRIDRLLHST